MLRSTHAIAFAAGGLLLLGACTYNPAPAQPAPVVVQERAPPATIVTPGSSVVVQPRY